MDRDWLYQKYIIEGLSCPQIGKLVNRDGSTIRHWLRKHGIPTRPRGHNREYLLKGQRKGFRHSPQSIEKIRQASVERGALPYLRDGEHYNKGKRGAVVANWKGGITPERQAFYRSEEWKAACREVWVRDDGKCRRCGLDSRHIDRSMISFHVHHIVTFANQSLRAYPHNLILLCDNCHYFIHSGDNIIGEFLGDYWRWCIRYCQEAEAQRSKATLFDVSEFETQWPDMPNLEGGVDMFGEYPVAGGPEA